MKISDIKQEQFMNLYNPIAGNLSAFCFAKTHDREEAKELVSETILSAYENFHTLKNETAFLSFMFSIASNIFKAKYKHSQRFVVSDPELMDLMYSDSIQPDSLADVRLLYEALDKLPPEHKEAIFLFDIMGLSQKEISQIQNITVLNVKIRIHRGKKNLAELLKSKTENIYSIDNSFMEVIEG
ncbi:MAG: RNA polymerase sigma factor [Candidatus Kapaibacterium sp.]